MWLGLELRQQIEVVSELSVGLKELHSHDARAIDFDWRNFIGRQAASIVERQKAHGGNPEWIERLPAYLAESLPLLPPDAENVFLHGDVHFGNLRLLETGGKWRISGLFDFADSLKGFYEYDFLAVGLLMIQGQGELQREFFRAYGCAENEINETLRRRLMLLTILYETADLRRYAARLKPEAVNLTLDELERAIWNFI
jgi:Ser/Thr protein kinase RdoA (MazF antagonist)